MAEAAATPTRWSSISTHPEATAIYGRDFPLELRHYFAQWIEDQPWATMDPDNPEHYESIKDRVQTLGEMLHAKISQLAASGSEDKFLLQMRLQTIAAEYHATFDENPTVLVRILKTCMERELIVWAKLHGLESSGLEASGMQLLDGMSAISALAALPQSAPEAHERDDISFLMMGPSSTSRSSVPVALNSSSSLLGSLPHVEGGARALAVEVSDASGAAAHQLAECVRIAAHKAQATLHHLVGDTQHVDNELKRLQQMQEYFVIQYQEFCQLQAVLQRSPRSDAARGQIELVKRRKQEVGTTLSTEANNIIALMQSLNRQLQANMGDIAELQLTVLPDALQAWQRAQRLESDDADQLDSVQATCEMIAEALWRSREQTRALLLLQTQLPFDRKSYHQPVQQSGSHTPFVAQLNSHSPHHARNSSSHHHMDTATPASSTSPVNSSPQATLSPRPGKSRSSSLSASASPASGLSSMSISSGSNAGGMSSNSSAAAMDTEGATNTAASISSNGMVSLEDLHIRATQMLASLIGATFVVETQPPQALKTQSKFSAQVRLLVGRTLNLHMSPPEVLTTIISEAQAKQVAQQPAVTVTDGKRASQPTSIPEDFNAGDILNCRKAMECHQPSGALRVIFKNLSLKKIKRGSNKDETVTDEKFALLFQSTFSVGGGELLVAVRTLSLPCVVIVHNNQQHSAEATILWDNSFATMDRAPFEVPEVVSWPDMLTALQHHFSLATQQPLSQRDLEYLTWKASDLIINESITWKRLTKEALPDRTFTFWDWFFGAEDVIKRHMLETWQDGLIMGFCNKQQAHDLLINCVPGTFLLRFSDSEIGGLTVAWITEDERGMRQVFNLHPWFAKDFAIRALADRIHDLPQLQFLFPDTPKDAVFGRHYSVETAHVTSNNPDYVRSSIAAVIPGSVPSFTMPIVNDQFLMKADDSSSSMMHPTSSNLLDLVGMGVGMGVGDADAGQMSSLDWSTFLESLAEPIPQLQHDGI
ncbi:transcription factor Stat5b [Capsaspora owczarzaki ATCC 30864]|uniref:Signal transducer and activator of transcription n=1 Tax=Capsaspora owczarzaki (strain ATCC 30864) TaxID=595528 RepID=A0A0D2X395_CAPO3|nr:transcription factor Stat5b [Capsaspora owczarzaki ATCC 30864]KJE93919.1 transcription factor Stat5b [Capsaspora owczarzaki ATCC 30864]|eukprot:XP_004347383.2 transcription factor Stat5b [Capsaspora owczarzaki ATCC 30864]